MSYVQTGTNRIAQSVTVTPAMDHTHTIQFANVNWNDDSRHGLAQGQGRLNVKGLPLACRVESGQSPDASAEARAAHAHLDNVHDLKLQLECVPLGRAANMLSSPRMDVKFMCMDDHGQLAQQ